MWGYRNEGATHIRDIASMSLWTSLGAHLLGKIGDGVGDLRKQTWRKEQLPLQGRYKAFSPMEQKPWAPEGGQQTPDTFRTQGRGKEEHRYL